MPKSLSSPGIMTLDLCHGWTMTKMCWSRHIANETLATDPEDDIFAALQAFIPLATSDDIQDWVDTYSSETWSSEEEKFRTITGDAVVRCPVSTTHRVIPLQKLDRAYQTIVADAEKYIGAWTYKWITPVPGSPFAEHATENWYQFLGVKTGYGTLLIDIKTPVDGVS